MITAQTIDVIGAGTMGTGIAQTCVTTGLSVVMVDVDEEQVGRNIAAAPRGQPVKACNWSSRSALRATWFS